MNKVGIWIRIALWRLYKADLDGHTYYFAFRAINKHWPLDLKTKNPFPKNRWFG